MHRTFTRPPHRPSSRATRRTLAAAAAGLIAVGVLAGPVAHAGEVNRIGGADRIETAVQIYENNRAVFTSDTVILVRSDDYADALTATPLAAAMKAPVLTTPPGGLDERVLASLKAQGVKNVVIIGGDAAVSPAAAAALSSAGMTSERIGGATRYETALKIADKVMQVRGTDSVPVFLATGTNFADALAAGSAAAAKGAVVLLTQGQAIDPATAAFIKSDKASSTLAVGGPAGRAMNSVGVAGQVIAGIDRYDTAAKLARAVFPNPTSALLASGVTYADSLAGAALAAVTGAPLLLTGSTSVPAQTQAYLQSAKPNVTVVGGPAVVPPGQLGDIEKSVTSAPTTGGNTGTPPIVVPNPPSGGGTGQPTAPETTPTPTEPSTLTWTTDLPETISLSKGDYLSLSWGVNWREGVTYQLWLKRPGMARFEALSPASPGTGVHMLGQRLEDSGTQYYVVAFWKTEQHTSTTTTVTVSDSTNQVPVNLEPLVDQQTDEDDLRVPVSVTVDDINSSSDGHVTIEWVLDEFEYIHGSVTLDAGANKKYTGVAQLPFAGTWKVRAAFHPKDPSRYALSLSEIQPVTVSPTSQGPLSDETINLQDPGTLLVGKQATFRASIVRNGQAVTRGRVTFYAGTYPACTDSDGSDGWSCGFTPWGTTVERQLRVKHSDVVGGQTVAKVSAPLDIDVADFTVQLSSADSPLDDVEVGANTTPLTASGRPVKIVAPDGIQLAGGNVANTTYLDGANDNPTAKPTLGIDQEGDLTISVPAGTTPGRWQFDVDPRANSGSTSGQRLTLTVRVTS